MVICLLAVVFASSLSNFLGRMMFLSYRSRSSISLMLRCALYRLLAEVVAIFDSLRLLWLMEWMVFSLGSICGPLVERMELLRTRVEGEGDGSSSEPFLGRD
jgi:hypothetical protein